MNVVGQHYRTRSRLLENPTADDGRAGPFPVERVNIPKNDFVSEFIVYPSFFPLCDRSVRRSKQCGTLAYGVLDCIVSSLQLTPNVFLGHLREVGVRPTVVSDFMTFARGPCHDLGMFGNIFADHKECGFDMMRSE